MGIQTKVISIVAIFTLVSIIVINLFLSRSLRQKDMVEAKNAAIATAKLVNLGILNTMVNGGDYDAINEIILNFQKDDDFKFRMVRAKHVNKQHGLKRNEVPKDAIEEQALKDGLVKQSQDSETTLRIVYPFVTDKRCSACHIGPDGGPVKEGVVNGLAVITFDLSIRQAESVKVIFRMMISLTAMIALSAIFILLAAHKTITVPMQKISSAIIGLKEERYDLSLPEYNTTEIAIMAEGVQDTAKELKKSKKLNEDIIEKERLRNAEVKKFVQSKARSLGLGLDGNISPIIAKLTQAVDDADRVEMISRAFKLVTHGESKIIMPSDPELIPAVSLYLGELLQSSSETIKKRTIELALDEALSNAVYHGNLELNSSLKDEDFEHFSEIAIQRMGLEPYASRKVEIDYEFDHRKVKFLVKDYGAGFDWRKHLNSVGSDTEQVHGRGINIIRALATSFQYNDKGNEVMIVFDLEAS